MPSQVRARDRPNGCDNRRTLRNLDRRSTNVRAGTPGGSPQETGGMTSSSSKPDGACERMPSSAEMLAKREPNDDKTNKRANKQAPRRVAAYRRFEVVRPQGDPLPNHPPPAIRRAKHPGCKEGSLTSRSLEGRSPGPRSRRRSVNSWGWLGWDEGWWGRAARSRGRPWKATPSPSLVRKR